MAAEEPEAAWDCGAFGPYRCMLPQPRLFQYKLAFTVVLSYALLPLTLFKSRLPSITYISFIIGIHVIVLFVYFWRVYVCGLDPDWRSLLARLAALALVIGLLFLIADESPEDWWLAAWLALLCCVHGLVLALLMVKVEARHPGEDDEPKEDQENTMKDGLLQ